MGEPRGGFYPDDEPPSRSAGVQQGREFLVCLACSRVWPTYSFDEDGHCLICHRPLSDALRVVEAVSPEPHRWRYEDGNLVQPEPREGEQEQQEPFEGLGYTTPEGDALLAAVEAKVEADNGSVASVLRLTASRLRDPEHRWYEDPAVTLERLAEKLEKD